MKKATIIKCSKPTLTGNPIRSMMSNTLDVLFCIIYVPDWIYWGGAGRSNSVLFFISYFLGSDAITCSNIDCYFINRLRDKHLTPKSKSVWTINKSTPINRKQKFYLHYWWVFCF